MNFKIYFLMSLIISNSIFHEKKSTFFTKKESVTAKKWTLA